MATIGVQLNKLDDELNQALTDKENDAFIKDEALRNELKACIAEHWIFLAGREIFEYRIDNASPNDCDWVQQKIGERLLKIKPPLQNLWVLAKQDHHITY